MNIARIKSVEEIVKDLRSKGELDEEVLEKFKKKNLMAEIFCFSAILVFVIGLLKDFSLLGLGVTMFMIWGLYFKILLLSRNRLLWMLNLFTYGKVVDGVITKYEVSQVYFSPPSFIVNALYISKDGKPYENKKPIQAPIEKYLYRDNLDNELKDLKSGSKIRVVYWEESPEKSWIYTNKLNNLYNIRKK